jgi:hypothetical protein
MARTENTMTFRTGLLLHLCCGEPRTDGQLCARNWTSLLNVFGDLDGTQSRSYKVHTQKELGALLNDETFAKAEKMQLVEVMMDRMDAPHSLRMQTELSAKTNMYVKNSAAMDKANISKTLHL